MDIYKRLDILDNNTDYDYWFVPKHEWNIISVCYGVSFLKEFKNNSESNLDEYYKRRANEVNDSLDEIKISKIHRGLMNSTYLGFTDGDHKIKNEQKNITSIFSLITERVNNKFEDIDKYKDIIENQMEKLYLQRKQGKDNNTNILLHPLFTLYKILFLIYDYTGKYEISMSEFKLFVCFVDRYENLHQSVGYIISSRLTDEKNLMRISSKIEDIRIHRAFSQLDTLYINKNTIKINNGFEEYVSDKLKEYEKGILPKLTRKNMDLALYSEKNIFDYYKGVQYAESREI